MKQEVIKNIKGFFHSRTIKNKHFDIISIDLENGVLDGQEAIMITIILRHVGLLIGKNGHKIMDLTEYLTEKLNKRIVVRPLQHKEWDDETNI